MSTPESRAKAWIAEQHPDGFRIGYRPWSDGLIEAEVTAKGTDATHHYLLDPVTGEVWRMKYDLSGKGKLLRAA